MDTVKLGNTGLDVSPICLGCMSFGQRSERWQWALDEEESRPIIKHALESGINFFDTANAYSDDGMSEVVVGRALKDFANRDKVVIATKVYFPMGEGANSKGLSRKHIMSQVDASLKRLGTDYIDLYQIHRWDYETPIEETLDTLNDIVRAGKVRYIGASSMFAWQFSKALYLQQMHGWARFVSMQNLYNLIYREEEREMLPLCQDQKIAVIPWSPLAAGRLARKPSAETDSLRAQTDNVGKYLFERKDTTIAERVHEVSEQHGVSMAQVALAWMLSKDVITSPIVGTTKVKNLDDAISALSLELTPEQINYLEEPYVPHAVVGHG